MTNWGNWQPRWCVWNSEILFSFDISIYFLHHASFFLNISRLYGSITVLIESHRWIEMFLLFYLICMGWIYDKAASLMDVLLCSLNSLVQNQNVLICNICNIFKNMFNMGVMIRDNILWYRDSPQVNMSPMNPHDMGLTHWGRVTHICVSKLTIIGSDNGLSLGRRQAIIWTNAGILLIRTLGTNFSEIPNEIHIFSFKKIHLKMSSGKRRPFCLGLNVLNFVWSLWDFKGI